MQGVSQPQWAASSVQYSVSNGISTPTHPQMVVYQQSSHRTSTTQPHPPQTTVFQPQIISRGGDRSLSPISQGGRSISPAPLLLRPDQLLSTLQNRAKLHSDCAGIPTLPVENLRTPASSTGLEIRPSTVCVPQTPRNHPITSNEVCKQTVLWDQRRVIHARELTPSHREMRREEREIEIMKPKVIRTDVKTERTMVVPETKIVEEIVEASAFIREKIVEIAKPVINERIVETYEADQVTETTVEDVHEVITERVETREVETIHECINNVFTEIIEELVVEIPEIEIKEVDVYKTIEVPTIHEELLLTEKAVTHYVDKPVPEFRTVKVDQSVIRMVPIPIEQKTTVELKLPKIITTYEKVRIPVYLPRFIEVPIAGDTVNEEFCRKCDRLCEDVAMLARAAQTQSVSLCKLESVGVEAKQMEVQVDAAIEGGTETQYNHLVGLWKNDKLQVRHDDSIASLSTDDGLTETLDRHIVDARDALILSSFNRQTVSDEDGLLFSPREDRQHRHSKASGQSSVVSSNRREIYSESSSVTRKTAGSSVPPYEPKLYRSRRAARRDVGGRVVESNETEPATPSSINLPTPHHQAPVVSFGMAASISSETTQMEDFEDGDFRTGRSPFQP